MNLTTDTPGLAAASMATSGPRAHGAARYLVAQLGARMHYAVPRMLEAEGMLGRFCTDICAVKGWPRLLRAVPARWRPAGLRRLLGRIPTNVPSEKIRAFTSLGWSFMTRHARARSQAERTALYLWAGKQFCESILREGLDGITAVYTFNSAGLELLRGARAQGIHRVMEQTIAPHRIMEEILAEEQERFPTWEAARQGDAPMAEFASREQAEWQEAQVILCGSQFVKDSIAACGGPIERCRVVPYGVDMRFSVPDRRRHDGPLRVLTVGSVDLRKGAPYVLETARRLQGQAIFRMVGPIVVAPSGQEELRSAVELTGPVPRSEVLAHFAWADVFFLPSMCEGSATVTYEALASGLPVICSPNTGSVVRDGVDGFVVPVRDTEAMAMRLEQFHQDRDLLEFAAEQARQRAQEYTLEMYRARLKQSLLSIHDVRDSPSEVHR